MLAGAAIAGLLGMTGLAGGAMQAMTLVPAPHPAAVGTPWLPAQAARVMAAAGQLRTAPQRPVWDGKGFYPSDGIEPLCPAADAGHVATVGAGPHAFRAICARDGIEYAWSAK